MHERYLERAHVSGAPWLLLEGQVETRLQAARQFVDALTANDVAPQQSEVLRASRELGELVRTCRPDATRS